MLLELFHFSGFLAKADIQSLVHRWGRFRLIIVAKSARGFAVLIYGLLRWCIKKTQEWQPFLVKAEARFSVVNRSNNINGPECEDNICPTSCITYTYSSSISYGQGFSDSALKWLQAMNSEWTEDRVKCVPVQWFTDIQVHFRREMDVERKSEVRPNQLYCKADIIFLTDACRDSTWSYGGNFVARARTFSGYLQIIMANLQQKRQIFLKISTKIEIIAERPRGTSSKKRNSNCKLRSFKEDYKVLGEAKQSGGSESGGEMFSRNSSIEGHCKTAFQKTSWSGTGTPAEHFWCKRGTTIYFISNSLARQIIFTQNLIVRHQH